jgi:hypothetical protein
MTTLHSRALSLPGEWLANGEPVLYRDRCAHFLAKQDPSSYCGHISRYRLTPDLPADRPCLWCLTLLIRDGFLHVREPIFLPGEPRLVVMRACHQ